MNKEKEMDYRDRIHTILFLDDDPRVTAKHIDDWTLGQQITVTTRHLLCAFKRIKFGYRDYSSESLLGWIMESESNYLFCLSYLDWLHREYQYRNKQGGTRNNHRMYYLFSYIKDFCRDQCFVYDYVQEFRYFGPPEYKQSNVFDSYLEFYNQEFF